MAPNEYRPAGHRSAEPSRAGRPAALSGKIYVKIMPADSSTMSRSNGRSGRIVIENKKKRLIKKNSKQEKYNRATLWRVILMAGVYQCSDGLRSGIPMRIMAADCGHVVEYVELGGVIA